MKFKYNLQYFGENENEGTDDNVDNNSGDNAGAGEDGLDVSALAEIISEKDKVIEQLQKDVADLKKSNANLLVKVNSAQSTEPKKSFEENLLSMVGAKPRKEK